MMINQPNILLVLDDEKLMRPVRRFTADYASRQLLGVMPHTLALTMCFIMQYRLGVNVGVEVELKVLLLTYNFILPYIILLFKLFIM